MLEQVADVLGWVRRVPAQVHQQQAADGREADGDQAVAGGIEVLDTVHVRRGAQGTVEVVGPGVVGTPEAPLDTPIAVGDQASAAVTADVVEGPRPAVLAADHDDAVAADLPHQEAARLAHLRDVPDADPAGAEDLLQLPVQNRRVGEGGGRQHRRLLQRPQRLRDLSGVERQGGRHRQGSYVVLTL